MADLVRDRLGARELTRSLLVGDRLSTDGFMASRLEVPFALLLSGVTTPADAPYVPEPAWVANDLAALVDAVLN
jgi:ribonucleotide monophosphatase NagD (HAD superfamily)